jgi:hypothetical protein
VGEHTHAATPIQTLTASPTADVGASLAPTTNGGFAADTALGGVLLPLSLMATVTSWKDFVAARKRQRELQCSHAKSINKLSMYENLFSFISAGAFHLKTAIALAVKPVALIMKAKGGAIGAASTTGAVEALGVVANFVLGPIAAAALIAEAGFSLRRYIKGRKAFTPAAEAAKARMEAAAQSRPAGMSDEEFAEFLTFKKDFFDHKLALRERFWRRAKNMSWFRLGASAFFGATTLTKVGLGIAAISAGGFFVSNPVGWALLGLTVVSAVAVTVGAFAYIYSRRRSRYEQYQRNDDPMVDKKFHQAVEAFYAQHAAEQRPAHAARQASNSSSATRTPQPATHYSADPGPAAGAQAPTLPRQARQAPKDDEALEPLMPSASASPGRPAGRTPSDPSPRQPSRRFAPSGYQPLVDMPNMSGNAAPSDDDDDEDGSSQGAPAAQSNLVPHGRVSNFHMIRNQQKAHQAITQGLARRNNKQAQGGFKRTLFNFFTKLCSYGTGAFAFSRGRGWAASRQRYQQHWVKHSRRLTSHHFRTEIAQHSPAWRAFMRVHLLSEQIHLANKQQIREDICALAGDKDLSDTDILRGQAADLARMGEIQDLLDRINAPDNARVFEAESVPDTEANRAFLKLITNRDPKRELSDEEIEHSLARAIKTQYTRRIADMKGTLFQAELDCAAPRVSPAAQHLHCAGMTSVSVFKNATTSLISSSLKAGSSLALRSKGAVRVRLPWYCTGRSL